MNKLYDELDIKNGVIKGLKIENEMKKEAIDRLLKECIEKDYKTLQLRRQIEALRKMLRVQKQIIDELDLIFR